MLLEHEPANQFACAARPQVQGPVGGKDTSVQSFQHSNGVRMSYSYFKTWLYPFKMNCFQVHEDPEKHCESSHLFHWLHL